MMRLAIPTLIVLGASLNSLAVESELIQKWEFHSPADVQPWSRETHDLKNLHIAENVLQLTMTGPDTFLA